jgi:hypothetical protein
MIPSDAELTLPAAALTGDGFGLAGAEANAMRSDPPAADV